MTLSPTDASDKHESEVGVVSLDELKAAIESISDAHELREIEALIQKRAAVIVQSSLSLSREQTPRATRKREGNLPSAASLLQPRTLQERPREAQPTPKPHLYRPKPIERAVSVESSGSKRVQPSPTPRVSKPLFDASPRKVKPFAVPSARRGFDLGAHRSSKEYAIPVQWWNAPFMIASFLAVAVGLAILGMETARVGMPLAELRAQLADPNQSVDTILAVAKTVPSSSIFRYDPRRDFLLGEAAQRTATGDGIKDNSRVEEAQAWYSRAIAKSPASLTYRLAWASSLSPSEGANEFRRLEKFAADHPVVLTALAERVDPTKDLDLALKRYGKLLKIEPDRTKEVSLLLREKFVPWTQIISILPPSPLALASVLELMDPHAPSDLKDAVQLRLTEITNSVSNARGVSPGAREWWAMARVQAWLGKDDLAVEAGGKALSLSEAADRDLLFLAEECCRVRRFDDAERFVAQALARQPSEDARRSAEKIQSLVRATREEPVGTRHESLPPIEAN